MDGYVQLDEISRDILKRNGKCGDGKRSDFTVTDDGTAH